MRMGLDCGSLKRGPSQGRIIMPMRDVSLEVVKEIASRKGLKPGRVKGTEQLQITKGSNDRVEVIDWGTFEGLLSKRGLTVRESGGFMKVMKK